MYPTVQETLQKSSPGKETLVLKERLRPFSVEEYHRMGEVGVLKEDERIELIDGIITTMNPTGSKHAACVKKLNSLFSSVLSPREALIGIRDAIVLNNGTEPEPDITLLKPREDAYADAHPRPADVLLVVEVADTSAEENRTVKLPRYAAAGIPEVWIIDIPHRRIEACQTPVGTEADAGYKIRVEYRPGETLSPAMSSYVQIDVEAILPPESE